MLEQILNIIIWILSSISIALCIFYAFYMIRILRAWDRAPKFDGMEVSEDDLPGVSVIVPVRNEAAYIEKNLEGILFQEYPKDRFEIIVIDDESTDNTLEIIKKFENHPNLKVLEMRTEKNKEGIHSQFKKGAIEAGILHAKFHSIIATDGDCVHRKYWLKSMAAGLRNNVYITGPVKLSGNESLRDTFQVIDTMGLNAVTAMGINNGRFQMSNGANHGFTVSAFEAVGGFQDINENASGDDILLAEKMQKAFPGKLAYIKDPKAIVTSYTEKNWLDLYRQRLRWTTKSRNFNSRAIRYTLILIWMFCASLILNFFVGWLISLVLFAIPFIAIQVKILFDLIYLEPIAKFFREEKRLDLWLFMKADLVHTFYVFIIGIMGRIKKNYRWKGRDLT